VTLAQNYFVGVMLQVRMLRFATAMLVLLCASGSVVAQPRLSAADCARVTAHVPDASVAYTPGVDASGRAVAPADLAPPPLVAPPQIGFLLSVDLAQRLNLPPGLRGELPLGLVVIENGQLLFNGRPIGSGTESALAAACAGAHR
jgi:hypothetical protein